MINAAIVGLGWWGRVLTDAVQGKSDAIRIVAGQTRTRSKAEEYATEKGFRLLDTYADVLADPEVQAVVLATPHSAHRDQIIAAAEAGKHVFVEKPITLTVADAEAALSAVDAAGVGFGIGFNRRFAPAILELKQRIDSGALGTLLHFEGTMTAPIGLTLAAEAWRAGCGGGPGGWTDADGHPPDRRDHRPGRTRYRGLLQERQRGRGLRRRRHDLIVMQLASGPTAYVGTTMASGVGFRMQAFGTGGWVEIRNPALNRLEFVPNAAKPMSGQHKAPEPEVIEYEAFDSVRAGLEAFAVSAEGGPAFPATRTQVLQGTAALEAIVESSRTGRPVAVPTIE